MPIRVACACGKRLAVKDELASRRVRCPGCQGVVAVPTPEEPPVVELSVAAPEPDEAHIDSGEVNASKSLDGVHLFTTKPIGEMIGWGILTVNIYATIWLNLLHGKMPARRPSDPSAGKAIGFLFIPFFNLYWFWFTYLRLLTRINELRTFYMLPPLQMRWVVPVLFFLAIIPWAGVANLLIFVPLFLTAVQSAVNSLVEASAIPAKRRTLAAVMATHYRACRTLRYVWGWYLLILSVPFALLSTVLIINAALYIGLFVVVGAAVLLFVGSMSAFHRARQMNACQAQLTGDESSLPEVLQAERSSSIRVRVFWAFICAAVPIYLTTTTAVALIVEAAHYEQLRGNNPKSSGERRGAFHSLDADVVVRFVMLQIPWLIASGVLFWKARRFPPVDPPSPTRIATAGTRPARRADHPSSRSKHESH